MSDYASRRISEAELSVMETLWDTGTPMTAKDLQIILKERRGWERTTVRSLLTRLQEKGSVGFQGGGPLLFHSMFQFLKLVHKRNLFPST